VQNDVRNFGEKSGVKVSTKCLPKIGVKALGRKGFKIAYILPVYQMSTNATSERSKAELLAAFLRFSTRFSNC
jgi:hypothetical protein